MELSTAEEADESSVLFTKKALQNPFVFAIIPMHGTQVLSVRHRERVMAESARTAPPHPEEIRRKADGPSPIEDLKAGVPCTPSKVVPRSASVRP